MRSTTWAEVTLTYSRCALLILAAGCAPTPNKPIDASASATTSYIVAKRAYVEALERALRPTGVEAGPYRLVAVTGPQWQIGAVVDINNPLNPLTDKCIFPAALMPKTPVDWSSLPGLTQTRTVDFSAGLPQSVLKFLGKDNRVGANFNLAGSGEFSLTDLQAKILAQDAFESGLSADCKNFLADSGGMVVRGIVTGKEVFKSGGQLTAGADLKILEDQVLRLKYDNKGDFQLEDKAPVAKMFMVAYFPRATRGSDVAVGRPLTDAELNRLERLDVK